MKLVAQDVVCTMGMHEGNPGTISGLPHVLEKPAAGISRDM